MSIAAMQLVEAACKGDIEECKRLIAEGAPIDSTEVVARSKGLYQTPLTTAIRNKDVKLFNALLDLGADVNMAPALGNLPPLALALHRGTPGMCMALLDKGAHVNSTGSAPNPLIEAATKDCLEVCLRLLQMGADVNFSQPNGCTPLLAACLRGSSVIAAVLVRHGVDVHVECTDTIYAAANCEWCVGTTPLHAAARNGMENICAKLLDLGADINAIDRNGRTPLIRAILENQDDVCQLLIARGADINACDNDGTSVINHASWHMIPLCMQLVSLGADVNSACDRSGFTPLINAARSRDLPACRFLLDHGANINAVTSQGNTALTEAARFRDDEALCSFLLDRGADPSLDEGKALYNAVCKELPTLATRLMELGAFPAEASHSDGWHPSEILRMAAEKGFHEVCLELLRLGAYVNYEDSNGESVLASAIRFGNLEVVEMLLEHGASLSFLWGTSDMLELALTNTRRYADAVAIMLHRGHEVMKAPWYLKNLLFWYDTNIRTGVTQYAWYRRQYAIRHKWDASVSES